MEMVVQDKGFPFYLGFYESTLDCNYCIALSVSDSFKDSSKHLPQYSEARLTPLRLGAGRSKSGQSVEDLAD